MWFHMLPNYVGCPMAMHFKGENKTLNQSSHEISAWKSLPKRTAIHKRAWDSCPAFLDGRDKHSGATQ